ncbi:MAG: hypothetical protein ABIY55_12510 [Kofleriaceae bacterium]
MVACGIDTAQDPAPDRIPVVGTTLDRAFQSNPGPVTMLDLNGFAVRDGAAMGPTIVESRRFYDTVKAPNAQPVLVDYPDPFTGAPPGLQTTAPLTLDAWKTAFNIPARNPGETLEAYRARAGVVIYYNKNELGLGRELGCAEFDDGEARDGARQVGVACYVSNYGTAFRDVVNSLPLAIEGIHQKNTVCITWRPSLPVSYQVQFYTYNGDGLRRESAQLDTLGPRPVPQVCMSCHGGSYDAERHLARNARFLPLDPNVVLWAAPGSPGGVTRAAQEERIRTMNLLSTRSPLTPQQDVMLDELYRGKLDVAGAVTVNAWVPPAWDDSPQHRQLFDKVIKPNCTTCHAAMQTAPSGDTLAIYSLFDTPALLEAGLSAQLCDAFTMPNSQATRLNLWEPTPVTFLDAEYDSAADVLLSQLGMDRAQCRNLEAWSSCNRGPDPDALCGNAHSGRACNRATGECVPNLSAPRTPGDPNGICKMDGSRRCPYPQTCRARGSAPPAGLESYDGLCGM